MIIRRAFDMGINLSGVRVFFRAFFCSEKEFISGPEPGGGGLRDAFFPKPDAIHESFSQQRCSRRAKEEKKNEVERL